MPFQKNDILFCILFFSNNTYILVTESEIQCGILDTPTALVNDQCLGFIRLITDIDNHLSHQVAWRFIDKRDEQLDFEAQDLMKNLRDQELPKKLAPENIIRYSFLIHKSIGILIFCIQSF